MTNLIDVLAKMKEYNEKGYDTYFEGQGDGNVRAIVEATFIVNKKIKNRKKEKNKN